MKDVISVLAIVFTVLLVIVYLNDWWLGLITAVVLIATLSLWSAKK